jgi:6-phosphogluconolactonase/glucosamine-6-phosphate isomerase/deaminase
MGEDGHVALLLPDAPKDLGESRHIYKHVVTSKLPPSRITLDYTPIAAARRVWVLASGHGKETALKNSLSESGSTPLARVLQQRDFTRIFTDINLPG